MAENVLDKLNELDASSPVTPEEFKNVWGISKKEHLSHMMDYIYKRKAEAAAEKNEKEMAEMGKQLADLKTQVAVLKLMVNQLKEQLDRMNSTMQLPQQTETSKSWGSGKGFLETKGLEKRKYTKSSALRPATELKSIVTWDPTIPSDEKKVVKIIIPKKK